MSDVNITFTAAEFYAATSESPIGADEGLVALEKELNENPCEIRILRKNGSLTFPVFNPAYCHSPFETKLVVLLQVDSNRVEELVKLWKERT